MAQPKSPHLKGEGRVPLNQRGSLFTSNAVIALFTVVLAVVSALQWKALLDANKTADSNLVLSQCAYLSIGKPEVIPAGLRVPIHNVGHAPATIRASSSLKYGRLSLPSMQAVDSHLAQFTQEGNNAVVISPGEASNFAFMLTLPPVGCDDESVKSGNQLLFVTGDIVFDNGFKQDKTLWVHLSCSNGQWMDVNEGVEFNLRK